MLLKKTVSIILTVSVVVATTGCSAFQPRQQHVTITASERNAQIFLNNNPVGTGTVALDLDRDRTYAISATSGGRTGSTAIGRKVSGTGVLDIVGGCLFLVPFVGCFTPGFWELDSTTVSVSIPTRMAQDARPTNAPSTPNTAAAERSENASIR